MWPADLPVQHMTKHTAPGVRKVWVQILAWDVYCLCGISKALNHSVPPFSHLEMATIIRCTSKGFYED
jgi:hypothetical protein